MHFGLEVVGQRETDDAAFARRPRAEKPVLEIGILGGHLVSIAVGAIIGSIVAPERGAEIGRGIEAHGGSEHMTHHLQFLSQKLQGPEKSIDLGAERQREIEVEHVVEVIGRVAHHGTGIGVPLLAHLAGVHAVVQCQAGRDVEVLEYIERGIHRGGMIHTVTPVLDKIFLEKIVLLGSERVLKTARIGHLDFLIPALVAHSALALERSELRHGDGHVGERHAQCGVGRALRNAGGGGERPLGVGDAVGHVHRAALGVLGERS